MKSSEKDTGATGCTDDGIPSAAQREVFEASAKLASDYYAGADFLRCALTLQKMAAEALRQQLGIAREPMRLPLALAATVPPEGQ